MARGGEEVKYVLYVLFSIAALLIGVLFTASLVAKQWWATAWFSLIMVSTIAEACEEAIWIEKENDKNERKRNK